MPRIPYAETGTEAEGATAVYAQLEAEFGFVPNLLKVLGHSGPATQAMGAVLDNLFHHLSLTPRIREMAYLTVANTTNAPIALAIIHSLRNKPG